MKPHRIAIAGLLALLSSGASAQTGPEPGSAGMLSGPGPAVAVGQRELTSPELVARDYFAAVRDRGFAARADFVHPDEMARFQQLLIPVFNAEVQNGGRALLNATFGREATMTDASLATPDDFMRRFARVMAVRVPDQPVGFDELVILGTVQEGDIVHVLARLRTGKDQSIEDRLEVASLLPYAATWKVILSPELEQAVWAMKRQAESGERSTPHLVPRPQPLEEPYPPGQGQPEPGPR